MMAKDEEQFFCYKTWEIIFPAIIQKKILSLIGRIDRSIGGIFGKLIQRIESRLFQDFNKMHRLGLFAPEEDDKLTIHIFSSLDLLWFFPFQELTHHFSRFDELVEPKDRKRYPRILSVHLKLKACMNIFRDASLSIRFAIPWRLCLQ
jgi:hypothetical protein